MRSPEVSRRRFLLGIFVVSGFTGLIYESIWSHYLKLFLGHAAYAQSLVLAIFMGGMALGSWGVAHTSTRIRRLLLGYIAVEALTGLLGLLFHPIFLAASDFSFSVAIPMLPSAAWIHAYKWTLSACLILPQSTLLGMTFPLISGSLIRRWPDHPGETLATLYFTNSLGAAIGVLVSGFVLIDAVGLPGTVRIAGMLNVALALSIWTLFRGAAEPAAPPGQSPSPKTLSPHALPLTPARRERLDPRARWFLAAAFATGAASFMYELGWIRMLSLVLGSSTHAFELMLSAFIAGLALGGLYVRRRIEHLRDPLGFLAGVMVVTGMLAALTLPAYNFTFDGMAWFLGTFARTPGTYAGFNLASQLIAAVIMIPATFCAGMTLPLLTQEYMRRGLGERAIGFIYSANTLGAIAGVLLTIHLLMPMVGVKGVILAGASIHVALGLSRLLLARASASRALKIIMPACVLVVVFIAVQVTLDPVRMTSGVYRTGSATLPRGASVQYLRDGKTATISLVQKDGSVTIATNGKPDASIQIGPGEPSVDETTMVLAAAIPLSMQPHPARVANIGFGSGLTAHALLGSERVQRLDSIEIEPFMVEAARRGFGPRIRDVFEDARSHVIFEDAKTFFASSRTPYDLIVSEPSNPWVSGVATLFSDEFYGHVTHYLARDGLFAQWVQVYETNLDVLGSIVKALAPHFGAYALYDVDDFDVLIVATPAAALPAPDEQLLQSPTLRAELARIGVQSAAEFTARKIGDQRALGAALAALPVPANSDFFPYVDLHAPRSRFLRENAQELPALTLLPIPFLELLDRAGARGPTAEPSVNSALVRDQFVARALDLRRGMMSGHINEMDPTSASFLATIHTRGESCAAAAAQRAWRDAARRISDETAAYLNAAELEPIWTQVSSSPCYREATSEDIAWVELFAAIARRDAPNMVKLGNGLLASTANSSNDREYLTTVTAAALVNMGAPDSARQLLNAQAHIDDHREPSDHRGQFDLALRELRAMTR